MRNETVDYDGLRARALDAVILNTSDVLHAAPTGFLARLEEQRARVYRALDEDLARWIGRAARTVANAWRRPTMDSRDRIIDSAQL